VHLVGCTTGKTATVILFKQIIQYTGLCDLDIAAIMRLFFVISQYKTVNDYLVWIKCHYEIRTLTTFRV
jgi:hypothetical protein